MKWEQPEAFEIGFYILYGGRSFIKMNLIKAVVLDNSKKEYFILSVKEHSAGLFMNIYCLFNGAVCILD